MKQNNSVNQVVEEQETEKKSKGDSKFNDYWNRFLNYMKKDPKNTLVIFLSIIIFVVIVVNVLTLNNPILGVWTNGSQVYIFHNSGIVRDGYSETIYEFEFDKNVLTIDSPDGTSMKFSAVQDGDVMTLTDTVTGSESVFTRISMDVDMLNAELAQLLLEYMSDTLPGTWVSRTGYMQFSDDGVCRINGVEKEYEFDGHTINFKSGDMTESYACEFISEDKMQLTSSVSSEKIYEYIRISDSSTLSSDEIVALTESLQKSN